MSVHLNILCLIRTNSHCTENELNSPKVWILCKLPLVIMRRPTFAPKIAPSRGLIPKPNYLSHPWTHPIYHPKPHPYPICHFATMHWTYGQTHMQVNRWLEGMFHDYRLLTLYRECHGLIMCAVMQQNMQFPKYSAINPRFSLLLLSFIYIIKIQGSHQKQEIPCITFVKMFLKQRFIWNTWDSFCARL